jgi:hypothetical protein
MRHALLALPVVLAACATAPEDDPNLQRAGAMIGRTEAELVQAMGVPNNVFEADGARFLRFDRRSAPAFAGLSSGIGLGFGRGGFGFGLGGGFYEPAPLRTFVCETTYELRGGRVRGFTLRGDGC